MDPIYIVTGFTVGIGLIGWLGAWIVKKFQAELDNVRTRLHKVEQNDAAAQLAIKLLEILRSKN